MRPSDVPTYVEAGAADLGITGKDVLMEQSEREVYELRDLGYGRCLMVLAGEAGGGPDPHQAPPPPPPPLPRDRAPGGDRRGQGLGGAGAVDGAGGGDRRP